VVNNAGIDKRILYGPGPLHLAHVPDEYVPIDDLRARPR
jgi:acetylornithine deacetylase/succinyl-diaminopimelate desuccinylase-like protein